MYNPQEYDDLPEDIAAELNYHNGTSRPTNDGVKILQVICDCGGSASLNQVIIGLFKKHSIKTTRLKISSRLSYMRKNGQLKPVETPGVFTLTESSIHFLGKSRTAASSKPAPAPSSEKKAVTTATAKTAPREPSAPLAPEPANVNKPRTITCSYCETEKTFPAGKIVFKFEGEEFCTPDCIKEFRESKL